MGVKEEYQIVDVEIRGMNSRGEDVLQADAFTRSRGHYPKTKLLSRFSLARVKILYAAVRVENVAGAPQRRSSGATKTGSPPVAIMKIASSDHQPITSPPPTCRAAPIT